MNTFVVRLPRDGKGRGVVERVRDGAKQAFEDLDGLKAAIERLWMEGRALSPERGAAAGGRDGEGNGQERRHISDKEVM